MNVSELWQEYYSCAKKISGRKKHGFAICWEKGRWFALHNGAKAFIKKQSKIFHTCTIVCRCTAIFYIRVIPAQRVWQLLLKESNSRTIFFPSTYFFRTWIIFLSVFRHIHFLLSGLEFWPRFYSNLTKKKVF